MSTEHEKNIRERDEYHAFIDAFNNLDVPTGVRRWHAEVIEMFENQFEEILYYGAEE